MPRSRLLLALSLCLACLVLLFACDPEKNPVRPVSKYLPQSSPSNCLLNLIQAYKDRNIDEYVKLFSTDFTFKFSPADIGDPNNPTPVSWGVADERTATENMFLAQTVDDISLSYGQTAAVPAAGGEGPSYPTWKIYTDNLRVAVDTRQEDGSQLTLLVDGDLHAFFLRPYPEEHASDGDTLWRIVQWEDRSVGSAKAARPMVETSTWGRVKALFR